MVTTAELNRRGLPYAVVVDGAATPASLADLDDKGLPYLVEVADGATMAARRALEGRGLRYLVPVLVDATPASKASLAAQGLRYAVQVDADILPADRLVLQRQGLACYVEVDSSGNSVAVGGGAAVGGAALLTGETNGFATDFTYATDVNRVAIKTAGVLVEKGINDHYLSTGTSPKLVNDITGALVWSPHNLFLQSENFTSASWVKVGGSPITTAHSIEDADGAALTRVDQGTTTVIGQVYTISLWIVKDAITTRFPYFNVVGTAAYGFSINTSTGAFLANQNTFVSASSSVENLATYWKVKFVFVAEATTTTLRIFPAYSLTLGGINDNSTVGVLTIDRTLYNRGAVPGDYVLTTTAVINGLAIDYNPTTHAPLGWVYEPAATNLLLNSTTLSTQNATVAAVAYVLSFTGTGTVTLSGVSTAGPLVGTGASNRVSLAFTPTAGTLTLTVSGTVSNAQLEAGTYPTSFIPTFAATVTRAADTINFPLSLIPPLGSDYSIYVRGTCPSNGGSRYMVNVGDGTVAEHAGLRFQANYNLGVTDNSVAVGAINQVSPLPTYGVVASMAARFKLNDCALSGAGGVVSVGNGTVDTTVTMPTVTEVRFGGNATGAVTQLYRIEKLVIVTPSWNDATLATKSAL